MDDGLPRPSYCTLRMRIGLGCWGNLAAANIALSADPFTAV